MRPTHQAPIELQAKTGYAMIEDVLTEGTITGVGGSRVWFSYQHPAGYLATRPLPFDEVAVQDYGYAVSVEATRVNDNEMSFDIRNAPGPWPEDEDDPLSAARGICLGIEASIGMMAAISAVILLVARFF